MPSTPTLGQAIQEARSLCDKTLRDVAKEVGVAPSFISDIENGNRNPSAEVLKRIADAVGKSYDDLKKFDTRVDAGFKALVRQEPEIAVLMRKIQSNPEFAKRVLAQMNKDEGGKK